MGRKLGSGGFCDVHEIQAFKPHNEGTNTERKRQTIAERHFLNRHARREKSGDARYAIKFIQEKWVDDSTGFRTAAGDLKNEMGIFQLVHHPNILKVRGWATQGTAAYSESGRHDGYFLILDRLYDTLDQRIKKWKKQEKRLNNPILKRVKAKQSEKKQKELFAERLHVAFDLAGAMEHIHERNLVYRDLKVRAQNVVIRGI